MPPRESRRLAELLRVEFSPLARWELLREVAYYAERGRAESFIAAISEALARVATAPHGFPAVAGVPGARRALTKRFPFAIVFLVGPRGTSEPPLVIAVAHGARRPGYWRRRGHK